MCISCRLVFDSVPRTVFLPSPNMAWTKGKLPISMHYRGCTCSPLPYPFSSPSTVLCYTCSTSNSWFLDNTRATVVQRYAPISTISNQLRMRRVPQANKSRLGYLFYMAAVLPACTWTGSIWSCLRGGISKSSTGYLASHGPRTPRLPEQHDRDEMLTGCKHSEGSREPAGIPAEASQGSALMSLHVRICIPGP